MKIKLAKLFRTIVRITFALVVTVTIGRTFVLNVHHVPTPSMEPTIRADGHVIVNRFDYGPAVPFFNLMLFRAATPERGDVVTFIRPYSDDLYLKRVVGVPGDTIEIESDRLVINGNPALYHTDHKGVTWEELEGVKHRVSLGASEHRHHGPIRLASNQYFMLGDNRTMSDDSRFWGLVPIKNIIGRVVQP